MTNSAPDKGTVAPAAACKIKSHASVSTNNNVQNQSDKEHSDDDLVTTPSVESPNEDANDSDCPDDTVESPPATPTNSRKKRKPVSAPSPQTPTPDKAADDAGDEQRHIKERISPCRQRVKTTTLERKTTYVENHFPGLDKTNATVRLIVILTVVALLIRRFVPIAERILW